MPITDFIFRTRNASIGSVTLDVSISEEHVTVARPTKHPVESAADITDHVKLEPASLTIEGEISNTPVQLLASLTAEPLRAETAYAQLLDIQTRRVPVTIETTLRRYENMILGPLRVPRNAQLGNTLHFTCTAEAITVVETQTVALEAAAPKELRGHGSIQRGNVPKQAASASQQTLTLQGVLKAKAFFQ